MHFGGERCKHASRSHMQRNCIKYLFYSMLLIFIIFEAEKGIAYIVNVHTCCESREMRTYLCNVHTSIFHAMHCIFRACILNTVLISLLSHTDPFGNFIRRQNAFASVPFPCLSIMLSFTHVPQPLLHPLCQYIALHCAALHMLYF